MNERLRLTEAWIRCLLVCAFLPLSACASNEVTTGIKNGRLTPCPSSPNCVSSDATDEEHRVDPYRLKVSPEQAWRGLQNVIAAEDAKRLVTVDDAYMHVEFISAVMRFVDDTEFHLRPDDGIIAVRSASRTGYNDMGVNRKRVERIRDAMRARDLVE